MSNRQQVIYCGKGREINGKYGPFYSISLILDDIPESETWTDNNGKRRVSLSMSELRNPDDRGNTHTIKVDGWKPPNQGQGGYQANAPAGRRPQPSRPVTPYSQRGQAPPPPPPRAPQGNQPPVQAAGPESFQDDDIPF